MKKKSKIQQVLEDVTRKIVKEELIRQDGNLRRTCEALGIGPKQLLSYRDRFPELNDYVVKHSKKLSEEDSEKRRIIERRHPDE